MSLFRRLSKREKNSLLFVLVFGGPLALIAGALTPICIFVAMWARSTDLSNAACFNRVPEYHATNDSTQIDRSQLTGKPCGPPCWQNITPGITSFDEASAILNTSPLIHQLSYDSQLDWMTWHSIESFPENRIEFNHGKVWKIRIILDYQLQIGSLVASLGDPDYVWVLRMPLPDATPPPCDTVELVWLVKGVSARLFDVDLRLSSTTNSLVGTDSPVFFVTYFPATGNVSDLVRTRTSNGCAACFQKWNGYDQIKFTDVKN